MPRDLVHALAQLAGRPVLPVAPSGLGPVLAGAVWVIDAAFSQLDRKPGGRVHVGLGYGRKQRRPPRSHFTQTQHTHANTTTPRPSASMVVGLWGASSGSGALEVWAGERAQKQTLETLDAPKLEVSHATSTCRRKCPEGPPWPSHLDAAVPGLPRGPPYITAPGCPVWRPWLGGGLLRAAWEPPGATRSHPPAGRSGGWSGGWSAGCRLVGGGVVCVSAFSIQAPIHIWRVAVTSQSDACSLL
jgi:hypothetical protein